VYVPRLKGVALLQGTNIKYGEQGTGITASSNQQIDRRWGEFTVSLCGANN